MTKHILQRNCRSVKANFVELNLFINENKPLVVCLQETFLKDSDKLTFNYHSVDRICGVWLSLCVCVRLRLSRVSLLASGSVCASACVSRLSRVSLLASGSVCASACVSRLCASRVCVRLASECVCVCLRLASCVGRLRASCLASVCVSRLSHVKGSECSRLSASVVLFRVCLSL